MPALARATVVLPSRRPWVAGESRAREVKRAEVQPVVEPWLPAVSYVVVVGAVATDDVVAMSGPRTTTMSAVPIELIGAAVVYGATEDGGSLRSAATAAADGSWPAT